MIERNAAIRNGEIDKDYFCFFRGASFAPKTKFNGLIFFKHGHHNVDSRVSKGLHLVVEPVFSLGSGDDCDLPIDPVRMSDHSFVASSA